MNLYSIMIVDDEENVLKSLQRTFRGKKNWQVETYANAQDALKRARCHIFDIVITDYMMPHVNGVEFLKEVCELQPDAIRILLTGSVNIDTLLQAVNEANAFRFIPKPWDDARLIRTMEEAIGYRDIKLENKGLLRKLERFEEMYGPLEEDRRAPPLS